ncbi:MAG: hypothetical protein Q4C20_11275 [Erysipelotrichaceae bacterium]|nr:hypothetical protein [Erysipelotrichaceae bacterium]
MKKLSALLLSLCLLLCGCAKQETEKVTITNPVDIYSEPAIMTVYEWIGNEIADFQEITFTESLRLFSEKGSGILYFGYDNCPFCERAVPMLNEAALETGVSVYYVDVYGVFQPTRKEFDELMGYVDEALIEDEDGGKSFFVPLILGIKNGEITGHHVALVDGFTIENEESQMNDAQKEELKNIYLDIIRKTAD